jgi:hypothetical protein
MDWRGDLAANFCLAYNTAMGLEEYVGDEYNEDYIRVCNEIPRPLLDFVEETLRVYTEVSGRSRSEYLSRQILSMACVMYKRGMIQEFYA